MKDFFLILFKLKTTNVSLSLFAGCPIYFLSVRFPIDMVNVLEAPLKTILDSKA